VEVTTPVFEGPFEVLMQLVLEHKVDVCDVPIAPIVEGFLRHISEAQLDLTEASEFLVIAAVLVELKSRKLLPGPDEIESDEEFVGLEQRDILLARLVELQAYSAAAIDFGFLIEQAGRSLPRTAGLEEDFTILAPDLLAGVGPTQILAAYRRATVARPQPVVDLSHVTVEVVSVSETVAELEAYLPGTGEVTFRELTAHLKTRMQVIVRFLALLELHKRGKINLDQGETFGDLHVAWIVRAPALEPAPAAVLVGARGWSYSEGPDGSGGDMSASTDTGASTDLNGTSDAGMTGDAGDTDETDEYDG
jgi:segregation and condensation protein A